MGQMNKYNRILFSLLVIACLVAIPTNSFAKEKKKEKNPFDVPNHVLTISKENTFQNSPEDIEKVEASKLTKELQKDIDVPIDNPNLIKILNETSLKPSPIAIGYRGMVYIGRWALTYESEETAVNWEYQEVNRNELNNLGGERGEVMSYNQEEEKEVKGALTNQISNAEDVKNMMLQASKAKTDLPLSFQATIGKHTKKGNSYDVPIKKQGSLTAFSPAANEKGNVTFGEVYIQLKGSKKSIVVKNITSQGVGAWIPIQDHISFSFELK